MKNLTITLVALVLMSAFAVAVGSSESSGGSADNSGVNEPGMGVTNPQINGAGQGMQTNNSGSSQQLQNEVRVQQMQKQQKGEVAQIKTMVQERQQQMQQQQEQQMTGKSEKEKEMLRNQNQVRLAVHALLDMEGLSGGIGKNVSAIAREFNNSVQSQYKAEEKIQTRSGFSRFFAGGDESSAKELQTATARNQEKIRQLNQIREQCNECAEEVKAMLQEQIRTMEQEQTRLQEMAQKEQKSKGLIGWIWK